MNKSKLNFSILINYTVLFTYCKIKLLSKDQGPPAILYTVQFPQEFHFYK